MPQPSVAPLSTPAVPADPPASPGPELLLELPPELFVRLVIQAWLSRDDRAALRQASRACRRLVNAATSAAVLDVHGGPAALAACRQVPASCPGLRHLSVLNTGGSSSEDAAASLEQQLPVMLRQLHYLRSLTYEGAADRRQRGLDMVPALTAATDGAGGDVWRPVLLRETAADALAGDAAAEQPTSSSTTHEAVPHEQLEVLELRAGLLPDALLEVVGRCGGLRELRLSSTTAINTAPLAALTRLTCLHLTVTPPLCAALAPLGRLHRLAELRLAALNAQARGWGAALAALSTCPLSHLQLAFADIDDGDIRHLVAGLTGLSALNLNCSRHLTPRAVPHLASLRRLEALHLDQTGLQLGHEELLCLGAGCPRLAEVSADVDLRTLRAPPLASPTTAAAAAVAVGGPASLTASSSSSSSSSSSNGWPALRRLIIPGGVSTANMAKLLAGLPLLAALELNGLGPNGNAIFEQLVGRAPQLQSLVVEGCGAISTQCCSSLGAGLRHLTSLALADVGVPGDALAALLQGLGAHGCLSCLTCSRLRRLDDAVLDAGVGSCSSLVQLELSACEGITGEGVLSTTARLPRLTQLELRSCQGVDAATCRRAWECAKAAASH